MDLSVENIEKIFGCLVFWRIENFNCTDTNFEIESQEFEISPLKSKWKMKIQKSKKDFSISLSKTTNPSSTMLNYALYLLTAKDWITLVEQDMYEFKAGGKGIVENFSKNIFAMESVSLHNRSLTISFRVWNNNIQTPKNHCLLVSRFSIYNNVKCHMAIQKLYNIKLKDLIPVPTSPESPSKQTHKSKRIKTKLSETDFTDHELLKQLTENKFSFVTLRTRNRDFFLQQVVLCAKSPVFNAMLFNRGVDDYLDIEDVDSETMTLVIKFLHSQPLNGLYWDLAVKLCKAAVQYEISELKEFCLTYFKEELSVENICDAFALAHLYEHEELRICAQSYFCQNAKCVLQSEKWRDFIRSHSDLIGDILFKYAETM